MSDFDPAWVRHPGIRPYMENTIKHRAKKARAHAKRLRKAFRTGYMVAPSLYLAALYEREASAWDEARSAWVEAEAAKGGGDA